IAIAAVLALLVAAWLMLRTEQGATATPSPGAAALANPGYSARGAVLVQTGADGKPMYTLSAARIQQEPASQVSDLEDVHLTFRDETGHLWNGRADHGRVVDDATQVDLSGNVQLSGVLASSTAPATISSERLHLDTRAEIVSTRDPVVLAWSGQSVAGRGMVVQLRSEQLRIESDVHGRYVP
ncbi:MAG TPA: LPS export ABC transporter periplasmic protein LptC, partial [Steroidobacteraceae bacterium]|nr:LPS export ABC transporter periplasmic protein LptC [Steroidobacteraceae bacterium]